MIDTVKTEDAVVMVLRHDITEIIPGEFKGIDFKKGHIITENDIDAYNFYRDASIKGFI